MKIHLKNFGPIHDFEFDLEKDFHVIYGENNIGKSYAMSAIYLILKNLPQKNLLLPSLIDDDDSIFDAICTEISTKLEQNYHEEFSIKPFYEEIVTEIVNKFFIQNLKDSFLNSLSNDILSFQNKYSGENSLISIYLDNEITILIEIGDKTITMKNQVKLEGKYTFKYEKYGGFGHSYRKGTQPEFSLNAHNQENVVHLRGSIKESSYNAFYKIFAEFEKIQKMYFLPASRSGLYDGLNILTPIFVELSKLRSRITHKIEIPALPEPIADYFLNISTIQVKNQENIYQEFAEKIEQKLLKAKIVFNENTKKLEYVSSDIPLKLNLSETSSMVSEIAPIVAHLKYLMSREDEDKYKIIFIEEPEAHLHPKIQVLLTEIFLELTKHKVKIVMTTHSNYIFNKINNLLLRKSIETDKIAVYHMIDTKKGSIVSEDSKPSEYGISDHNFAETSEQLYQERLDISDEWN